jgi:hypothetical protein
MAKSNLEMTIETITPAKARSYLEANTSNRRIRRHKVESFSRQMAEGKWLVTHQGIAFNCDGTLLDGQHRLHSIVESGVTVRMMVVRGVPKTCMLGIDQGTNRDGLDISKSLGIDLDLSKPHFSVARGMMFSGSYGLAYTVGKIPVADIIKFVQEHFDAIDFSVRLPLGICNNAVVRSVLSRAWYTCDRERIIEFSGVLATGVMQGKDDMAAIAFRNMVMRPGAAKISGAGARTDFYRKTESALRAFLKREPIIRIYAVEKEQFPIPGDE